MLFNCDVLETKNPAFTKKTISQIEQILKISLPHSYISLMTQWNGGYIDEEYFSVINGPIPEELKYYLGDGVIGIDGIFGISTIDNSHGLLYNAHLAHDEWGIDKNIIPINGDGHIWIAFDFRDKSCIEPTIIFIESDCGRYFKLADNFISFINTLKPYHHIFDQDGNLII